MAKPPVFTAEQFAQAFLQMLPRGRAWPKEADSRLAQTVAVLMLTAERVVQRAGTLVVDAFPSSTVELLPEWEASPGLPDPCQGLGATVDVRRAQVVARFARGGGQSVAALKAFAAALGYDVSVTELEASRSGALRSGSALYGEGSQYVLSIDVPTTDTIRRFRAGTAVAGEALSTWGNAVLECELLSIKPAHSGMVFTYSGVASNPVVPAMDFGTGAARGTAASDHSANLPTVQNAISGAAQNFRIFSVTYGYADASDSSAVFVVENTGSGGFADRITHWQATNGSTQDLMLRDDPKNSGATNNGGASSYNFTAGAWHLLEGRYDGAQVSAWVDGVQQNGSDSATFDCGDAALSGVNATRIGSRTSAGSKARNLRGRLAEVIVCNALLTAAERNALVNYLNSTYGLSSA